jgi:hypothetical protein
MGTIHFVYYVACFTAEDGGVYHCGHTHRTVRSAMNCLIPDGGGFVRAFDKGISRSLDNMELIDFLESLPEMPWSMRSRRRAQEGASVSAAETPQKEPPVGAGV